eukprot:6287261-Amphidinium_carterae.1
MQLLKQRLSSRSPLGICATECYIPFRCLLEVFVLDTTAAGARPPEGSIVADALQGAQCTL